MELWKDADPELQPGVREVRARLAPAGHGDAQLTAPAAMLDDRALLARLVGFDTTSRESNLPLADFLADYLDRPGVRVARNPSADGAKTNLVVAVGPETDDREGLVLVGPHGRRPGRGERLAVRSVHADRIGRPVCRARGRRT